ncbi:MAG: hypothetical protein IJ659_04755 [Alloprevotella sp.]|nr:hypothetical protein [Alloprevotella sp.]
MKKIYFVPATEVVALNVQQMLAQSPNVDINKTGRTNADAFDTRQSRGVGGGLWEDMK